MKVSFNSFKLFFLSYEIGMHVNDFIFDLIKIQIAMDLLLGDLFLKLS